MADTERVKPRSMYVEEAIAAALESRWSDAVAINELLIERHGPDEEAYNRIGKALSELGRLSDSLQAYRSALELNPLNPIAQKQSRRIVSMLDAEARPAARDGTIDVDLFTEEPGKSGRTILAPPRGGVSAVVAPGDPVQLIAAGNQLLAETARGVALGAVESKLGGRLRPLMASGNRYSAAVARIEEDRIEIIIRETHQSPENVRKSSFPVTRSQRRDDYRPYAKEALLSERGEDDEGFDILNDDVALDPLPPGIHEELAGMHELDEFQADGVTLVSLDEVPDGADDDQARPEDDY